MGGARLAFLLTWFSLGKMTVTPRVTRLSLMTSGKVSCGDRKCDFVDVTDVLSVTMLLPEVTMGNSGNLQKVYGKLILFPVIPRAAH